MAQIRIEHETALSCDQIRERLQEVMEKLETRFGLQGGWNENVYNFKRSGVDGSATITDGKVVVVMNLGLVLGALKSRIETEMMEKLKAGLP